MPAGIFYIYIENIILELTWYETKQNIYFSGSTDACICLYESSVMQARNYPS